MLIERIDEETQECSMKRYSESEAQKASILLEMQEITQQLLGLQTSTLDTLITRLNDLRRQFLSSHSLDPLDKLIAAKRLKR